LGQNFIGKDLYSAREAVDTLGYLIDKEIFQSGFANLFIDALAIENRQPLYQLLGGTNTKVEVGISIPKNIKLVDIAKIIEEEGYKRIKVKVGPSTDDFLKIKEIKDNFPNIMLMVDANSSFDFNNTEHVELLIKYGKLDLLMIEQPLAHDDIENHISLQQEFYKKQIPGRICLDESIHKLEDLRRAISGGIPIINIKVPRVGGLDLAQEMVQICQKNNVDTWIGGMLETTAPDKAHSLALASHPGITLPSDISGTNAYFENNQDPCLSSMSREGRHIQIPNTIGRGWEVDPDILQSITQSLITFGK
jgi:O-succinylbenzoate synthase